MGRPIEFSDGTRITAGTSAPSIVRALRAARQAVEGLEEYTRSSAYDLAVYEAMQSLRTAVNWLEEAIWSAAQPAVEIEEEAWTEEEWKGLSMSGSNELTTELQRQC